MPLQRAHPRLWLCSRAADSFVAAGAVVWLQLFVGLERDSWSILLLGLWSPVVISFKHTSWPVMAFSSFVHQPWFPDGSMMARMFCDKFISPTGSELTADNIIYWINNHLKAGNEDDAETEDGTNGGDGAPSECWWSGQQLHMNDRWVFIFTGEESIWCDSYCSYCR